jgi:hypothetical protein
MSVDWVARGIGLGGLALAGVGTLIAVLAFRRDRPDIRLMWSASETVPELVVSVVNGGYRPVTLSRVWIAERRAPLWVRLWPVLRLFRGIVRLIRGDLVYDNLTIDPIETATPVLLGPGATHVVRFEAERILTLADSERRGRPWIVATDVLERRVEQSIPATLIEVLRTATRRP